MLGSCGEETTRWMNPYLTEDGGRGGGEEREGGEGEEREKNNYYISPSHSALNLEVL